MPLDQEDGRVEMSQNGSFVKRRSLKGRHNIAKDSDSGWLFLRGLLILLGVQALRIPGSMPTSVVI
jgi:hypothetical protein